MVTPLQLQACTMFAWFISRTFSVNEQYISLTTNQLIILSIMAYQPSEQGTRFHLFYSAAHLHLRSTAGDTLNDPNNSFWHGTTLMIG